MSLDRQRVNICALYRAPYSQKNKITNSKFLNDLPNYLDMCNALPGAILVLGDFNIHADNSDDASTRKLNDIVGMFGFEQSVNEATHEEGHTVDLVLSRNSDLVLSKTSVDKNLKSDHFAIKCKLNVKKLPPPKTTYSFRKIKNIDPTSFKSDLLDTLPSISSVRSYNECMQSLLDKHAPIKTLTKRQKTSTPWFSSIAEKFLPLRRERRKAERKFKKSGFLPVFGQIYHKISQQLIDLVDNAKTAYFSAKIKASRTCKELYSHFDLFTGKKTRTPLPKSFQPKVLPNLFSDFFSKKISNIRTLFPSPDITIEQDTDVYTGHTTLHSFDPVSEDTIKEILKSCQPKSCELDPMPTSLLFQNMDALLPTLTNLINISLSTGKVPDELKTALVRPLLKKPNLDCENLTNFRPISNLPFLSKLLEKVVLRQLLSHLENNQLCNVFQSAYRAGHSTETALLRVVNDLLQSMDQNKISILLLLDLSAAFDTVDHKILLHRLQYSFGIESTVLNWFNSYLIDRKQFVSINNLSSSPTVLKHGVPQGSVLGPVLFVLYTTPLSQLIRNQSVNHQLFADDTQLHKSSSPNSLPTISNQLRSCISEIKDWMTDNQLKLNDDKTEALLFSPLKKAQSSTFPTSISVGDHDVSFSDSARNLGFFLDSDLSMKAHVKHVCKIAHLELRRINSIRRYLTQEATKTLVTSCILSRLDYCNSLLMGTDKAVILPLQRVQNFAARLIFGASRRQPTTPLLKSLHWLPVSERIKFKVCCICFNSVTNTAPEYLSDILPLYSNLQKLRSASDSRKLQEIDYNRKSHGYRSMQVYGPRCFNSLPFNIRHADNIHSFKSQLKTHLFGQYFP